MFDLFASFFIGFVGSLHCLGMCGPLIMAYSLHIQTPKTQGIRETPTLWSRGLAHHLSFHMGRILSYGLLGALAAGFAHMASLHSVISGLRNSVTLGGGILMILLGLFLLKIVPLPFSSAISSLTAESSFFSGFLPFFDLKRLGSKMVLGLLTGFLPCMLSWSMIIKAATTENFLGGFLTMAFFGLGTVPALFFTGLSASLLSFKIRLLGERIAALSVIVMGFILVFKGSRYLV